jgi:hypothetical protein
MESKTITHPVAVSHGSRWRAIMLTGFLAGTLDAIAAIVVYQANPIGLFKFIAAGAFGTEAAFAGGTIMVVWGILFHYFIAFSWTALFFFVYPAIPLMRKNKYVTGLLYGIFVWIMMNQVVVPLSQIVQKPFNPRAAAVGASILMVAIGLPISILAHRYYARKGVVS